MIAASTGSGARSPVTLPPSHPDSVVSVNTTAPAITMRAATPPTFGADDDLVGTSALPSRAFITTSTTTTIGIVTARGSVTNESRTAEPRHANIAPANESCHERDLAMAR